LVGGNAMTEVSINLNALAAKQQSIVGIPKGTCEQLRELVELVADKKVTPPLYTVHNFEDSKDVFEELAECRLTGRAVLKFGLTNTTHGTADITDNC
jgi:D-arabinose 1-dehydrogenase-like Zn-dependent alcohol dehydrogenase